MWIIGETKDKGAPTIEQCEQFVKEKDVTFPVMRDAFFLQTYAHIKSHSNALPHQYILDAKTMELVYATGGVPQGNAEARGVLTDLLGIPVE